MSPAEAIDALTELVREYDWKLIDKQAEDDRAMLSMQRTMVIGAMKCIYELKDRLVRQACYFEHIEAEHEPRQQWPLLEDDDPGLGL